MAGVPLHRNRDFVLFQFGQLLSSTGSQVTSIAYPLLVLSLTHSASKAGIEVPCRPLAIVLRRSARDGLAPVEVEVSFVLDMLGESA